MTQRARFDFKARRLPSGDHWIVLEPLDGDLNVLNGCFLGFDLSEGTTANQAEEVAAFLNENILSVSYTTATRA
jgi:hypothetical protein